MFRWIKKIWDFFFPPYHPHGNTRMDDRAVEILQNENIKTSSRKGTDNYYNDGGMTP